MRLVGLSHRERELPAAALLGVQNRPGVQSRPGWVSRGRVQRVPGSAFLDTHPCVQHAFLDTHPCVQRR